MHAGLWRGGLPLKRRAGPGRRRAGKSRRGPGTRTEKGFPAMIYWMAKSTDTIASTLTCPGSMTMSAPMSPLLAERAT